MRTFVRTAVLALALAACDGLPAVNEATRVEAGQTVEGDINTVNGGVFIGEGARVNGDVITINGPIAVGRGVEVWVLQTINGAVDLGAEVKVHGGIGSINGRVTCGAGSRVGGGIATVNGGVDLEGTDVKGTVKTHNGGVWLRAGSSVHGDIVIEAQEGDQVPVETLLIRLEGGSVLKGSVRATASRRPVEVRLSGGSRVLGRVDGARVTETP